MSLADRMGNDQFYSLLDQAGKEAAAGNLEGFIAGLGTPDPFA